MKKNLADEPLVQPTLPPKSTCSHQWEPFFGRATGHQALNWQRILAGCAWATLVFNWLASQAYSDTIPVVIGFERFARHGEISSPMAGGLLLAELSCTACHTTPQAEWAPKAGPKLESAGLRLEAAWIAAYLDNPHQAKPGTTMPDMLKHLSAVDKQQAIDALVAFLMTQTTPLPEPKASGLNPVFHEFWNKGDSARGEELMHRVGCVACHQPTKDAPSGRSSSSAIEQLLETLEPEELAKLGLTHALRPVISIPMADASRKYTAQGLAMFLLEPESVRPAGRMPNLKLNSVEAADIAAFLRSRDNNVASQVVEAKAVAAGSALASSGKRLFSELGCAHCHQAQGVVAKTKAKALVDLQAPQSMGCLGDAPRAGLASYGLDELQTKSILSFLDSLRDKTTRPAVDSDQKLQMAMLQLNCYACHQRNQLGGLARGRDAFFETVGQIDIGDEGRLPPPLTGVGRKHQTAWLKKILQGSGDVRPYLQIRMPKYPSSEVEPLIPLLATVDRRSTDSKPAPKSGIDAQLAASGRDLFNQGCVQCHPVRGEALPSVVGIDLGQIGSRIDRTWFSDFLLNPASLKPRTRMPSFFAEGSINQDILAGNVTQQIAALWTYLDDIQHQPLPEKIEVARRQNFELIPTDQPIVLRTFMDHAGTHAIAVGFPQKNHFAFDAEQNRLAELWHGRFLDAQGTWNDRFSPPAVPLGQPRFSLPTGPDLAYLATDDAAWPKSLALQSTSRSPFLGYMLDRAGIPTFRYQIGSALVEDRYQPLPAATDSSQTTSGTNSGGMIRQLTIVPTNQPHSQSIPPGGRLWLRLASSQVPLQIDGGRCQTSEGLRITLDSPPDQPAITRSADGQSLWLLPISLTARTEVSLTYQW